MNAMKMKNFCLSRSKTLKNKANQCNLPWQIVRLPTKLSRQPVVVEIRSDLLKKQKLGYLEQKKIRLLLIKRKVSCDHDDLTAPVREELQGIECSTRHCLAFICTIYPRHPSKQRMLRRKPQNLELLLNIQPRLPVTQRTRLSSPEDRW